MLELIDKIPGFLNRHGVYWFCALSGTSLLVIQILLNSIGFDHHHHDQPDHHDIDTGKIKWLSKQVLTCFLMMFGWTALACERELGFQSFTSILISLAVGLFTAFIIGLIFKLARKLKSTGTLFNLEEAIGQEATIYQRIPEKGVGKISISLQHMTHEIDALSLNGEEIPSFTTVHVLRIVDDKTVIVVPIKKSR